MSHIRHAGLVAVAVFALLIVWERAPKSHTAADDQLNKSKQEQIAKLVGTWVLEKAENPGSPSGIGTRLKMFNGTHWCVVQPDDKGHIVFQHGGTYSFDGAELKEKIDFAGELTTTLIGTSARFNLQIDGDTLKQTDPNGVFNEVWRRAKHTPAK